MTAPASDLAATIAPDGLPADLASIWSTAIAALTPSELSALVLRFGFGTGKPESFGAIGRELGVNRIRAQAIFTNALGRLGRREETRALARYLTELNAVLSSGAEAESSPRKPRAVASEELLAETSSGRADADLLLHDGDAAWGDHAAADAATSSHHAELIVDPHASTDEDEEEDDAEDDADAEDDEDVAAADEPVSERDALKLVLAADRELARAIEHCAGREELVAALQRARNRIAAGLREIEQQPPAPAAKPKSQPVGERRAGRPFNVAENERRMAVLARVESGDLTNAGAAAELGIKTTAWSSWKGLHRTRLAGTDTRQPASTSSEMPSSKRGRGRPENTAETERRVALLARIDAGALTNAGAAAQLGITPAAWSSWKSYNSKRTGRPVAAVAAVARPTSERDSAKRLARLDELERFGVELRERVRAMVRLVEGWFPG